MDSHRWAVDRIRCQASHATTGCGPGLKSFVTSTTGALSFKARNSQKSVCFNSRNQQTFFISHTKGDYVTGTKYTPYGEDGKISSKFSRGGESSSETKPVTTRATGTSSQTRMPYLFLGQRQSRGTFQHGIAFQLLSEMDIRWAPNCRHHQVFRRGTARNARNRDGRWVADRRSIFKI